MSGAIQIILDIALSGAMSPSVTRGREIYFYALNTSKTSLNYYIS